MWFNIFFLILPFIICLCIIIQWVFIRFFLWYLAWILYRKHNISLKVKVGILNLNDLTVSFISGGTIEVQKIWISSCFLNSKCRGILSLCASQVVVEGNIYLWRQQKKEKTQLKTVTVKNALSCPAIPSVSRLIQISLQVFSVKIVQSAVVCDKKFRAEISLDELVIGVKSTGSCNKRLDLEFSLVKATGILSEDLSSSKKISVGLNLQCRIQVTEDPLVVEHFHFTLSHPEVVLHNAVLQLFHNKIKSLSNTPRVEDQTKFDVWKLFPQNTSIIFEDILVKIISGSNLSPRILSVFLQDARLNKESINDSIGGKLLIENFSVLSGDNRFASLAKYTFEITRTENVVETTSNLASCHLMYLHDELQFWTSLFPLNKSKNKQSQNINRIWWNILPDHKINCSLDVSDISLGMSLPNCSTFTSGMLHSRMTFALQPVSDLSKCVLSPREMSMELVLETAWCHLGQEVNPLVMKRYHLWNTPLSFGMLFLKARDFPLDFQIRCMVDVVRAEWCPKLSALLEELNHFFQKNKQQILKSPEHKGLGHSIEHCSLQINLTSLNIFFLSERGPGLMLRVDSSIIDTEKELITIDGLKVTTIVPSEESILCLKSGELTNNVQHISSAQIKYQLENKEISLQLSDEVSCLWTTAVHMIALSIIEEMQSLVHNLKGNNTSVKSSNSSQFVFRLKIEGKISADIILSKNHRFSIISSEISAKVNPSRVFLQLELLRIDFDGHQIFTFMNFSLSSSIRESEHYIRQNFDGLEQQFNKSWNFKVDELRIVFPYEYNFAEAVSEQAVSVVKWLKLVHKRVKKPFTEDSPLPPDLTFKIKSFLLEIGDDPFEVKLKDNYALLEDEYHESLKRRAMLDEKVENLRMTHLLFPSERLEELYVSLSKKNADIYIQRSRQMYSSGSMRTAIFTWQMENVDVMAVADTSYHGTQKVVAHMHEIDSNSAFPEDGVKFVTLWCRKVNGSVDSWSFHLRDFPQPMLEAREFHVWGQLIGAEEAPSKRATRTSVVEVDEPWGDMTVERSMPSLKFFHDFTWDLGSLCMAYGPCWEPVVSQVVLNFESISKPSLDPSPTLPWWDKMRLLCHGRLTLSVQHLSAFLQASLDPYNTTEQMEISWTDVIVDWVNAKIMMKGDLDIYTHTASKYDDCRLLHVPNVKLSFKLEWLCLGNPNDHHGVMPCAPDKIPEYSSNQVHDSYRAFRSQNLNLSLALETKSVFLEADDDVPGMLLYNSTLRWLENLKFTLGGIGRLTRRGVLFNNTKPHKPQLGRHYRTVRLSINLHKSQISYWSSTARLRGFEVLGGHLSLGSEHTLSLKPVNDGLIHRLSADWGIAYLTCDLSDSEIWLHKSLMNLSDVEMPSGACVERGYFVSMKRVSYGREAKLMEVLQDEGYEEPPTHRLVVHGLRGAWTKNNRDVVFELFDSFTKAKLLKRNLSTEALKGVKVDSTQPRSRSATTTPTPQSISAASPIARLQSGHVAGMLQKLIAEAEANPTVYTEEIEGGTREQQLYGVAACQTDDVLCKNWLVELVNSQVMLQGVETLGYVIVSAARTEILSRCHCPVWKDRTLKSKTTWVGSVECLQYYATVDAGQPCPSLDNIMWLSVDNIEEKSSFVISEPPDLVGSGQSVGGVVSSTVGGASLQLQRIISRCGCHFFYASYGENVDAANVEEVPPLPEDSDLFDQEVAVDSFTLTHHDLTICTNSLQYAMILDIINNLLLYVEPRRKEASERLQRMRFRIQLSAIEDRRGPVLQLQDQVRTLVLNLKRLEREMYTARRVMNPDEDLLRRLEDETEDCKERLMNASEDLAIMISCFKEAQIKTKQRAAFLQDRRVAIVRRSEVCFKYAQWRLTDADGQLGIAGLELANFLYSKITKDDDSVEHLCEVGCIKMSNLLPNQVYKDVLQPTELQPNIPLDRQRALRVYCRERAPVGGISVKELFEVNVIPITISLTSDFFTTMIKFFFPGRDAEKTDYHHGEEEELTVKNKKKMASLPQNHDDIEKMKERAERNHTFLYIKIPEVPLRVSYKGQKEKNIRDLHDFSLTLPTLEYHNQTWTWLDLLMAMKNDTKRFLLPQAIKQKLQIKSSHQSSEESSQPQEEDKARLLLGAKLLGGPEKSTKKSIFKSSK